MWKEIFPILLGRPLGLSVNIFLPGGRSIYQPDVFHTVWVYLNPGTTRIKPVNKQILLYTIQLVWERGRGGEEEGGPTVLRYDQ